MQPTEEEIQFILDAIADYLVVKVRAAHWMPAAPMGCRRLTTLLVLPLRPLHDVQ